VHKLVITRKANQQTGFRDDNYIEIRKNQFTSREVVIQINDASVISLGCVIRDPSPMFFSLIVRMWIVQVSPKKTCDEERFDEQFPALKFNLNLPFAAQGDAIDPAS
jgi:hypothetical protein